MKTANKILSLALAAVALTGVSACVETAPEYVPGEAEPQNGVYFLNTDKTAGINPVEYTVGGSDHSYTYWLGRSYTSGSLTVNITNNSDSRFTVPSSVSFADGEATAPLVVTFESLPPQNVAIDLTISDSNKSIYGGVQRFQGSLNCLWSSLGKGYWFDYLALWGSDYNIVEVEVLQSNLDSHIYKVATDPYTKELISDSWGASTWGGDLNPDGIELTISDDNLVSWSNYWNSGIIYTGDGDATKTIRAWYPLDYSSSYTAKAEACMYYPSYGICMMYPCWYITGVGGWGSSYYPVILGMPGAFDSYDAFYAFIDSMYGG